MYSYLDLPKVPTELILPLEEILKLENIFGGATDKYTIHECQNELRDFLQQLFPSYTKFRYQTLREGVPVHIDRGRTEAINYLIDTGGDNVSTVWYEYDWTTPFLEKVFEAHRWHKLQVDIYHGVSNIKTCRYAITIG